MVMIYECGSCSACHTDDDEPPVWDCPGCGVDVCDNCEHDGECNIEILLAGVGVEVLAVLREAGV